jgi:Pentapeptide repeats (9 copies)
MRDENCHLARRFILHHYILFQVLTLILLIAAPGVAQSTTPAATPTPDRRSLDEARRDNEAAQADYYRVQAQKLSTPDQPKTLWQRLSDNAAILGALTAALVAVFSLIFNQRAALRARKDTEFYEALKRFGDKDSPTVRASAATILLEMTKTTFFAWRWRKNAPWWRPDLKMIRYPYFDTILDQLITGLLLEENHVVFDKILRALKQFMPRNQIEPRNFELVAKHLFELNMKLQRDVAESLKQFLVAKGLTSINYNERQPYLKEAHALTSCSELALEQMYEAFPRGMQSFDGALGTFSVMDEPQKRAHLLEAQKRLTDSGVRLQLSVELCSGLLSNRPANGTPKLDLSGMYLEKAFLIGANLQNVVFSAALMNRADLSKAKLAGARFVYTDLRDSWFYRADLTNTAFFHARLSEHCNFIGANWWQADFEDSSDIVRDVVLSMVMATSGIKEVTAQMLQEAHPSVKEFLKDQMKVG